MPLQIVRNDITKVEADAIVNTANPHPIYASGTDHAIYLAAGAQRLLAERKKIGNIEKGKAAITPAFHLKAKYIIHTVGPAWEGGNKGEYEILKSCYENSLELASQYHCQSIAFPLIATGVYGFPKDQALSIALSTITNFLMKHEMLVTLVVFNKEAFQISSKLYQSIQSYIDENYVEEKINEEYFSNLKYDELEDELEKKGNACGRSRLFNRSSKAAASKRRVSRKYDESAAMESLEAPILALNASQSLNQILGQHEDSFKERLIKLVDQSGLKDSEVYNKANMSRQTYHNILKKSTVSKNSVIQLAIALELDRNQTEDLLSRAGYAFSPGNKADLIIGYFIDSHNYNITEIDAALYEFEQKCLFSVE